MESIKKTKNNLIVFVALYFLFFSKSLLMIPIECLGIETDYFINYNFSLETASTWFLAIAFPFVGVLLISKLYQIHGAIAAAVCTLALAEPFFSMSQNTPIKLFLATFCLLCFYIGVTCNNTAVSGFVSGAFLFVSALLLPNSVFSYVPLVVGMYMILSKKVKPFFVLLEIIGAVTGFILNKSLSETAEAFRGFINRYSFAGKFTEVKSFEMIFAFLPFVIIAVLFLKNYLQLSNKRHRKTANKVNIVYNLVLISYICALAGMILFKSEAFFTVNIILLVAVLGLIIIKDEVCLSIIGKAEGLLNKHPVAAIAFFIIIYIVSLKYTNNFYNALRLIRFIRY